MTEKKKSAVKRKNSNLIGSFSALGEISHIIVYAYQKGLNVAISTLCVFMVNFLCKNFFFLQQKAVKSNIFKHLIFHHICLIVSYCWILLAIFLSHIFAYCFKSSQNVAYFSKVWIITHIFAFISFSYFSCFEIVCLIFLLFTNQLVCMGDVHMYVRTIFFSTPLISPYITWSYPGL